MTNTYAADAQNGHKVANMKCVHVTLSLEAAVWFADAIADKDGNRRYPTLLPQLGVALSYADRNDKGQIVEAYTGQHVFLGWNPFETYVTYGFHYTYIADRRVFVHPNAVAALAGNIVTLEAVNVAVPNSLACSRQMLLIRRQEEITERRGS